MRFFPLNLLLALGLFCLNALLGAIQYRHRGDLFAYGKFSFDPKPEQQFSGNFFQKTVNPAIYTALLCALFQRAGWGALCRSLWLTVPLYWMLRALYIAAKNRFWLINRRYELLSAVFSLLLGEGVFFGALMPLMEAGESVFISAQDLRNAVWFAILAYIAKTAWDVCRGAFEEGRLYSQEVRSQAIRRRYDVFSRRYGASLRSLVDGCCPAEHRSRRGELVCLLYAVMIYEDHNRPPLFRAAERLWMALHPGKEMTLGIMQVKTRRPISDTESIRLAAEKLVPVYLEHLRSHPLWHALRDYNSGADYVQEVTAIYNELLQLLSYDELAQSPAPGP